MSAASDDQTASDLADDREAASVQRADERQDASSSLADEREQAAIDRDEVTRADVAALAIEVGGLRAILQDLHDLVLDTLVKSETAAALAEQSPSREEVDERHKIEAAKIRRDRQRDRLKVYSLVGIIVALIAAVCLIGVRYVEKTNDYRDTQYRACEVRNDEVDRLLEEQANGRSFLAMLAEVQRRGAARGEPTAKETAELLSGRATRPLDARTKVDCESLRP